MSVAFSWLCPRFHVLLYPMPMADRGITLSSSIAVRVAVRHEGEMCCLLFLSLPPSLSLSPSLFLSLSVGFVVAMFLSSHSFVSLHFS